MSKSKRTLVFSRGPNQGYRTYTAEQIKAGMQAPKPQHFERKTFERPFGSIGTCAIHGSKAKTLVNGVCQACSHKGWNVKKVQDHLAETRKVGYVTGKLVGAIMTNKVVS